MASPDLEKLKALKAVKARRLREELMHIYKAHSGQVGFHYSPAKIRGLFGGNQSGKTLSGSMEMAWAVGKCHPYRENFHGQVMGRDCCIDFGHVLNVLVPTYKKLLPRNPCLLAGKTFEGGERRWPGLRGFEWDKAYDGQNKILYLADGSLIEFKSYDQGWERFQGAQRHIIRMDEEPGSGGEKIFDENLARQTTLGVNIIITMTPLNYSQWLYGKIFEKSSTSKDIECFSIATKDNPYANPDVIAMLEDSITDPAERAARLYGEFTFLSGRVFPEYGDHNFIDWRPIPDGSECSITIDQHREKPTAVAWIAEAPDGKMYVYREGEFKGDVSTICDEIISETNENITLMLIDPSSREKSSIDGRDGRLIDLFRKKLRGLTAANNNRDMGIEAVKSAVRDRPKGPKLYVMRNCPKTDFQMRNYSWKPPTASGEDRRRPEVVKRNDDFTDCVRYRVIHRPIERRGSKFEGFGIGVYGNAG